MLGLADDQRERAEHLGALAEHAGHDPCGLRGRRGSAARRDGLAQPSSSRSPAAPRSPPTTTVLGVEHVAERGRRAWPSARPASAITRRQPSVAAVGQREISATRQVLAVAAAQQLERAPGRTTTVSRQPRLPQRQIGPVSSTSTWPISPAMPPRAAVQAAVEDQPGADAGRDLHVDAASRASRAGAERDLGERAEVGVVVDEDRQRRAGGCISSAAATPTQPGRIAVEPTTPSVVVDRARQAPCRRRSRRRASTPASASSSSTSSAAASSALLGVVVDVERRAALGEDRCDERSETATRRWLWPKSMPTAAPAERSSESRIGGRPGPCVAGASGLGALDDEPVGLQVGDQARDGRARQAGAARDLGAAEPCPARAARR